MRQDLIFHILKFLHFSDNNSEPDKAGKNYERLWKITVFDRLNDVYAKYYSPAEHLAVDESLC
jgi:hypothetical protein